MKRALGILQITLSLAGVIMCGTVTYAAINMVNGQYQVEIAVSNKGLNIKSNIDKRQCTLANSEQTTN
ncbi:hypothetical protein [Anabaena sp. UHCC 0399]|uniref:hypothetical protein n=1 Tax=Anabaena sp. UHCC 0399 TaxID=3110238 RepID=UPI001683B063|nr:hypothetical protein [Anabaena sp. UHCC 0399]MBD2364383.1 hypothetical protein [Anabaena minutissima FACHB-250]MEA5564477.1 hypothetical protein [Anabaena sp. UHCC 0399]